MILRLRRGMLTSRLLTRRKRVPLETKLSPRLGGWVSVQEVEFEELGLILILYFDFDFGVVLDISMLGLESRLQCFGEI